MTDDASFELMDVDAGNLVGSFAREAAALAIVREAFAQFGEVGVTDPLLVRVEADGNQQLVADGDGLRQRLRAEAPMA